MSSTRTAAVLDPVPGLEQIGMGAVSSYHRAPEAEGPSKVSDPEPDAYFRKRLLRVLTEADRQLALVLTGDRLDALGRKYDRFRTGVPLKGLEKQPNRS
jgi:hypothetical protein